LKPQERKVVVVYLVSLVRSTWSYDHTVKLKLNKVLFLSCSSYNAGQVAIQHLAANNRLNKLRLTFLFSVLKHFLKYFFWNVFLHLWLVPAMTASVRSPSPARLNA